MNCVSRREPLMERVPTKQAAREIGVAVQTLLYYMEQGKWDLGTVVKSTTGKTTRHIVFRSKLDKFLGRTNEDKRTD